MNNRIKLLEIKAALWYDENDSIAIIVSAQRFLRWGKLVYRSDLPIFMELG